MRRFWLGIGVLVFLSLGSLAVGKWVEQLHAPVVRNLEQAISLAEEGAEEAALQAVRAAKEQWDRGWQFVAAFADHEPMDEVDNLFSALRAYAPDSEEFVAYCQQLLQRTGAVLRNQTLSWWNLL